MTEETRCPRCGSDDKTYIRCRNPFHEERGPHWSGESTTCTQCLDPWHDSKLVAAPSREERLEKALRAIVEDANNRNEPGQAWDLVAGGLIDDAEALL